MFVCSLVKYVRSCYDYARRQERKVREIRELERQGKALGRVAQVERVRSDEGSSNEA